MSALATALSSLPLAETKARPFLKFAGGKGQLLPQLEPLFPTSFKNYHEPFVGGGAVFFHLSSRKHSSSSSVAFLSDINQELVTTYCAIRDDVHGVIAVLKEHRYEQEYFYKIRSQHRPALTTTATAARMIFLNRSCFNGLYRVNKSGEFNVPFGRYTNPLICDAPNLHNVSRALQGAILSCASFREIHERPQRNDFVYLDPPYVPLSKTANFTAYDAAGFTSKDQLDLRNWFAAMTARGVKCMLSNADTPEVHTLYKGFNITSVSACRNVNSKAAKRGVVGELVVRNYE